MWEFKAAKADRLDRTLREQGFAGREWLSRQAWEWLVEHGRITVNGRKAAKAGANLAPGDAVRVDLPGPLGLSPAGSAEPVWMAPDGSWGVFDKPVGVDTVALLPWDQCAFASRVASYAVAHGLAFAALATPPAMEGGLVQRLDRDTSGLVSAAFTAAAKARLRELFSGAVGKTYDALVKQAPAAGEHRVWLAKESGARVRAWSTPHAEAEEVSLTVEVYKSSSSLAWLRVCTRFGRRHVVRAGLAALGAPLVGDALYGGSAQAPHHQLHAGALEIPGAPRIEVAPPESFLASAAALGLN